MPVCDHQTVGTATFERIDRDGERTLMVTGEVDLAVKPDFEEQLTRLLAEAHSPGYVDLAEVTFMDSSGLAALINAKKGGDAMGVGLTIVNPSEPVRQVLSISGVDHFLHVRDRGLHLG